MLLGKEDVEELLDDGLGRIGRLRRALEEDRSGSDIHQSWRLRLFPNEKALAEFLEEDAYLCVEEVIRPDFELLLLDRRDRRPKVEMKIRKGRVQEIIWINSETR